MVLLVQSESLLVGYGRVKNQQQSPQPLVQAWPARAKQPVHGIVAKNEQACLKVHANQDGGSEPPPRQRKYVTTEQANDRDQPAQGDEAVADQPPGESWSQGLSFSPQRRKLSSSAGEASRSIATK